MFARDLRSRLKVVGLVVIAIVLGTLIFLDYPGRLLTCGLRPSYATGEIVDFERSMITEKNPHNPAETEYHLGNRPIIRLEPSRNVKALPERAPTPRKIGDTVRVCYDSRHPDEVYILN